MRTARSRWTTADIGDLTGRRIAVTGVTSGLGEQIIAELARHGAAIVALARSADKLEATVRDLRTAVPGADVTPVLLDLADLSSVRRAAAEASTLGPLDVLINNAGVMATPYQRTVDGYELQFATNHLGPFALTGLLLPRLVESGDARVVSTASQAHRMAVRPPLGDPRSTDGRYLKWQAYARSKLADLLFTFELDRRLQTAGLPVKALAAHPGLAATALLHTGRTTGGRRTGPVGQILDAAMGLLGQPSELGAQPTLMAATADLPGGTYVGPDGPGEARGRPTIVGTRRLAHDVDVQRRLWELSESATSVSYP